MPTDGYRNLSLTTEAASVLKNLVEQLVDELGRSVTTSEVVRIAVAVVADAPTAQIKAAADHLFDRVTVYELARRLGLPEHEVGVLGAWTGAPWGTVWTEGEAAGLIYTYQATCNRHGVFECTGPECQDDH